MAADARWLKLKLSWQNMSREKQSRSLGLLFIVAVAFIWVHSRHQFYTKPVRYLTLMICSSSPSGISSAVLCMVQVLASFLVQDLEAEGLNPFLLTYIANSLFIVYLPAYALAKRCASHGLKGRQALTSPNSCWI